MGMQGMASYGMEEEGGAASYDGLAPPPTS